MLGGTCIGGRGETELVKEFGVVLGVMHKVDERMRSLTVRSPLGNYHVVDIHHAPFFGDEEIDVVPILFGYLGENVFRIAVGDPEFTLTEGLAERFGVELHEVGFPLVDYEVCRFLQLLFVGSVGVVSKMLQTCRHHFTHII